MNTFAAKIATGSMAVFIAVPAGIYAQQMVQAGMAQAPLVPGVAGNVIQQLEGMNFPSDRGLPSSNVEFTGGPGELLRADNSPLSTARPSPARSGSIGVARAQPSRGPLGNASKDASLRQLDQAAPAINQAMAKGNVYGASEKLGALFGEQGSGGTASASGSENPVSSLLKDDFIAGKEGAGKTATAGLAPSRSKVIGSLTAATLLAMQAAAFAGSPADTAYNSHGYSDLYGIDPQAAAVFSVYFLFAIGLAWLLISMWFDRKDFFRRIESSNMGYWLYP